MEDMRETVSVEISVIEPSLNLHDRGIVGVATASLKVKKGWAEAKKTNPRLSLKMYARKQVAAGDLDAREWLENKAGLKNQKRTDANVALPRQWASATKTSRRATKKS